MNIADAAKRAAAWLEANPDKHIARNLAVNADGYPVRPDSPEADCFCALGRLGHELGLSFAYATDYGPFLDIGVDYDAIFTANDEGSELTFSRPRNRPVHPTNPALGIKALRDLTQ